MNVLGKIRRLRFREGLSVSEISRRLGVARNTVKRWLKSDGATEPKYQRNDTAKLITAYEADGVPGAPECARHRGLPQGDATVAGVG